MTMPTARCASTIGGKLIAGIRIASLYTHNVKESARLLWKKKEEEEARPKARGRGKREEWDRERARRHKSAISSATLTRELRASHSRGKSARTNAPHNEKDASRMSSLLSRFIFKPSAGRCSPGLQKIRRNITLIPKPFNSGFSTESSRNRVSSAPIAVFHSRTR